MQYQVFIETEDNHPLVGEVIANQAISRKMTAKGFLRWMKRNVEKWVEHSNAFIAKIDLTPDYIFESFIVENDKLKTERGYPVYSDGQHIITLGGNFSLFNDSNQADENGETHAEYEYTVYVKAVE